MSKVIVMDTTPLGVATQLPTTPERLAFHNWIADCHRAGHRIVVPEVADYEIRRELVRANNVAAIGRLDNFISAVPGRYVPITTTAMRLAADLWARARNVGMPTADRHALDGDVILAAQALTLGVPVDDVAVVTDNVAHLSRYVTAAHWQNIAP